MCSAPRACSGRSVASRKPTGSVVVEFQVVVAQFVAEAFLFEQLLGPAPLLTDGHAALASQLGVGEGGYVDRHVVPKGRRQDARPGLALGVIEDFEYEPQYRTGLKPGQVIIIGTDGIWESCNPSD